MAPEKDLWGDRLKIAVVTSHFPSPKRPTHGRSVYDTLRQLALGADVEVFFPRAAYPSFLKARSDYREEMDAPFEVPSLKTHYIDYPAVPILSRLLNGEIAAHRLLPHVRAFSPDVILGYFFYPDCYAGLRIGQALGVPMLAKAVGSDVHSVKGVLLRMLTRKVLQEANGILTVSDDLRKAAIMMGAPSEHVVTNMNGCDAKQFYVRDRAEARNRLGVTQDEEAVIYIGRLDKRKGLRELIAAAAVLHASRPRMHVYLLGHGPDKGLLEAEIRSHGSESYIHLQGACAQSDVPTWIAASNVIALPSYAEGCPNIVLEALACGRPVVATKVGGIPEIMDEQCGVLVRPKQITELAHAISDVLSRDWDSHALSARQSRSWKQTADELIQVISAAMSRARLDRAKKVPLFGR